MLSLAASQTAGQPILVPFLTNVVAGLTVAAVLVAAGVGLYLITGRRRVKSFFGIGDSGRVVVYVSRIGVPKFSGIGVDGQPRSYTGGSAAGNEFELASEIQQFFVKLGPPFLGSGRRSSIVRWIDIEVDVWDLPTVAKRGPFDGRVRVYRLERLQRCIAFS